MTKNIVPPDSRYIPFTQQPSCCVPACFQMVMHRHGIPLIPQEELGYHLGLIVHPSRASLFYNVRTSEEKPPSGYGTRIYLPEFEPNGVFKKLKIPLKFSKKLISKFSSKEEVLSYLLSAEKDDRDILLCFNHGVLISDSSKDWGHVCVFDRLMSDKIRIIDPSPEYSKWRIVNIEKMFEAMQKHGEKKSGGLWELKIR